MDGWTDEQMNEQTKDIATTLHSPPARTRSDSMFPLFTMWGDGAGYSQASETSTRVPVPTLSWSELCHVTNVLQAVVTRRQRQLRLKSPVRTICCSWDRRHQCQPAVIVAIGDTVVT